MPRTKRPVLAREIAVQALYQFDISRRGSAPMAGVRDLESFVHGVTSDAGVRRRALVLVDGTLSTLEELDRLVRGAASHWKLERLAAIDRAILRVALFEMLEMEDVPPKVAIHEAIELAKRFSTADSGAFVNGILDRIWRDLAGASSSPAGETVPPADETVSPAGETVPPAGETGTPTGPEDDAGTGHTAPPENPALDNGHDHAEEVVREEERR